MSQESDMSLFKDVLEPFRRAMNTDPHKDKLSTASKPSFSDSSQSLREDITNLLSFGKRKSTASISGTPEKRLRGESSNATAPMSPWETRRLKADLIAAKAQISRLELQISQQHAVRKDLEALFDEEKAFAAEQHRKDENALTKMQKHIDFIRKREQSVKEELLELQKTHTAKKYKLEKEKQELQKQVAELKRNQLETNTSNNGQMSEVRKDMDELVAGLEGAQSEIDMLKKQLAVQTAKADECVLLKNKLDKQTFEFNQVTFKLKELENEKENYSEWKKQAMNAQKRLANMADLEKEVIRLRATERSLRDAVCNKLLLEEQVHSLSARLDSLQAIQQDLHEAKVKVASLEATVEEWMSAARNHGADNPQALTTALEAALQNEIKAVTDCTQAQSKLATLTEEAATMKYEKEKAVTKLNDFLSVRKNQESLIHRLQKRLLLVTRERDSYRQQLDCYEKELSVTLCGESGAGSAALLSSRVEQLEKSLQGYRDLLAQQDTDSNGKILEKLRAEVTKWRDEAESLRRDCTTLRSQRDNLQLQMERIHEPSTKVLHLTENPAATAQKQIQVELKSAQEEIKTLKAALRDGGSQTMPEEVTTLKQQLDSSRIKLQRMKEEFTSSAQEYRDVCYMLLGYKVDRTGHKNYRISNMYAESSDEYLTFTLVEEGIEMVHTDYSATLSELVDLHLHQHQSIPVFLSALTMELFTRTTIQHDDVVDVDDEEEDDDNEEDDDDNDDDDDDDGDEEEDDE